MKLLTRNRIEALAKINRYAGWTTRPFSVLEHSVIGAKLTPNRVLRNAFLLHDMHETEFGGDITSPVKRKYISAQYHLDVKTWDLDLAVETHVPYSAIDGDEVHYIDALMLAAETRSICAKKDFVAEIPVGGYMLCDLAKEIIKSEAYAGDNAITAFWQMWVGE
jgi:hypothetical protein